MAQDHFQKHDVFQGKVDWNFNLVFADQPQVAKLATQYAPLIKHPGLYPPIPGKWLHATILRAGLSSEYSDNEMQAVAKRLKLALASFRIPELRLGSWWLWSGNPVLHIAPEEPLVELFNTVMSEMEAVVGKERMPKPSKFIPHVTLAYNRTYDEELEVYQQLSSKLVKPVSFRATSMPLIKQSATDGHYEWKVIEDIPIGITT